MNDNKELAMLEAQAKFEEAEEAVRWEEVTPEQPGQGQPTPETAEMVTGLLLVTFELIASRAGDHWRICQKEGAELGKAYGAVIDKHFPDAPTGPEVTAIMLSLAVFGPRYIQGKQQAAERGKEPGQ